MASLAVGIRAWPWLGEGGVAVGEGRVAVLAPVRLTVAETRSGVTMTGDGVAVVAHLAGGPVAAPPCTNAVL